MRDAVGFTKAQNLLRGTHFEYKKCFSHSFIQFSSFNTLIPPTHSFSNRCRYYSKSERDRGVIVSVLFLVLHLLKSYLINFKLNYINWNINIKFFLPSIEFFSLSFTLRYFLTHNKTAYMTWYFIYTTTNGRFIVFLFLLSHIINIFSLNCKRNATNSKSNNSTKHHASPLASLVSRRYS